MKIFIEILILSGLAKKDMRIAKGKELWTTLNDKLPPAVAVLKDDQPRVNRFKQMVFKLPKVHQKCLKEWLQDRVDNNWRDYPEDVSFLQEKAERKEWQIYSQHLDALD